MSVRFILGRSGSGKTSLCLEEIREKMKIEPNGHPVVYLVPEQMTFLSEYKLITTPGLGGMIRTQVLSFTRLAWKVLQETGGISRYHLNSTGVNMLIRKIIEDKKDELKIFQRAAGKNGFIGQMEQMLTEFKRYCIEPGALAGKREELESRRGSRGLQDKLHDMELIYKQFEEGLLGKYVDSEDYFRLLTEKAGMSEYLKNAEVYIDGFYSYTPQEYMIIQQLIRVCKRVTVTFTLDRPYKTAVPEDLHLFRMSAESYQSVYEIAGMAGAEMEQEVLLNGQQRWDNDSLRHMERAFSSRPAEPFAGKANVHIAQAVNRRAEIEGAAREIKRLAAEEGYRFKDIALLMRNGSVYHDIIETIFDDYGIPFFIDQKRTMMNHPLIELIRSSLEVITGYWRYEPVFRAVKTELLFPSRADLGVIREKMDKLENYVLAYGVQGEKWTKKDRWNYRRIRGLEFEQIVQTDLEKEREEELNQMRDLIAAPILRLSRRLKKADSGRRLCEAVYLYLEELDIPTKLERWKLEEEDKGNLVKAREHDQAWNAVMELLDQFVEMLGDEKISMKQFASILDSGMESLRFSLVPPAMDQVLAADLDKSRLSDIKAAFVIGLNEGVLPGKFTEEGVLADADREKLLQSGLKIAHGSKVRLLDEDFLAYRAFSTPSSHLYISYPLANEEGKALMPSPYISRANELFPEAGQLMWMADPFELPEEEQLLFAMNEDTSLSYLASQLQMNKRGYKISGIWWDVYNYYHAHPRLGDTARKVLSSLHYENRTARLSEEAAKELYGETIQASVSRMELFHSCPFSHFAQHGLKLRDRKVFRLEAPDIGDLFHAALKFIAETVMDKRMSWSDMTRQECEKLAKEAVEMLAPKLQNEILLSSNRHFYIKRKLENIISRASYILSEHSRASGFSPVGLELGFGPKDKLPPLSFKLRNGTNMELVGRIDRVDKAENENGVYLRVIDYKSSARDLNISEVYYGLALQMLTYLDIIITHSGDIAGKKADPAGVMYFHVHNPIVNSPKLLTLDEIEEEIFKKFKMNGLLLGDENVLRLMDKTIDSGDSSIISAGFKKDGTITKRSKVATRDDFESLRKFVRGTYTKTGDAIISGSADISPYKMKDKVPCTFCSFKSVCQFDESVESNEYRVLSPKSNEELMDKIRKEAGENG
ncbi:helicase-exonuclease AddAB subunit AddB [Bacillus infantis]|uniref:helicase-exonuclease AddAB subunit AddB n=1 Tax=Bacillus infantis TaxID=324767 RepID=UPI003CF03DB0